MAKRRRKGLFGTGVKLLGKVDLLGLNALGQNPGMSPLVGVGIGGGVATLTRVLAARSGKNPELYGTGAGLLATGVMYAMKRTRHAALGALAGTALAAGLPFLLKQLGFGGLAGLGVPQIRYLNGLGVHQVDYLNGLGVHTVENTRTPHGTIPGVHGLSQAGIQMGPDAGRPPVDLLGRSAPGVALLGSGPMVSGLASQFGATIFGGSR